MFLIMCLSKYLLKKNGDTKGQSEKTYNTMAKGWRRIGQIMIYKTLHIKVKIEQHESY